MLERAEDWRDACLMETEGSSAGSLCAAGQAGAGIGAGGASTEPLRAAEVPGQADAGVGAGGASAEPFWATVEDPPQAAEEVLPLGLPGLVALLSSPSRKPALLRTRGLR